MKLNIIYIESSFKSDKMILKIFTCYLLIITQFIICDQHDGNGNNLKNHTWNDDTLILKEWYKMIDSTHKWVATFSPMEDSFMAKMRHEVSIQCQQSINQSINSFKQLDDWAMKSKLKLGWFDLVKLIELLN